MTEYESQKYKFYKISVKQLESTTEQLCLVRDFALFTEKNAGGTNILTGAIATAETTYSGYSPTSLNDADLTTEWCSNARPGSPITYDFPVWFKFELPSAASFKSIRITNRPRDLSSPSNPAGAYNIKEFGLYGSNDNVSYTKIMNWRNPNSATDTVLINNDYTVSGTIKGNDASVFVYNTSNNRLIGVSDSVNGKWTIPVNKGVEVFILYKPSDTSIPQADGRITIR